MQHKDNKNIVEHYKEQLHNIEKQIKKAKKEDRGRDLQKMTMLHDHYRNLLNKINND